MFVFTYAPHSNAVKTNVTNKCKQITASSVASWKNVAANGHEEATGA